MSALFSTKSGCVLIPLSWAFLDKNFYQNIIIGKIGLTELAAFLVFNEQFRNIICDNKGGDNA